MNRSVDLDLGWGVDVVVFVWVILFVLTASPALAQDSLVPSVNLEELAPGMFTDDELDLPYYLSHFHTLANSVVMSGPHRGFIDMHLWRGARNQNPHNARIMENVLSLAFFYTTDRPWNPYYGDPTVKLRLEAALSYWVSIQRADGLFSEIDPEKGEISPTGFGIKYMATTLRLLHEGPSINAGIFGAVVNATERAIRGFLSSDDFFLHGTRYSNHYTAAWGGALSFLHLYPDRELENLLKRRIRQGLDAFQSPAGFFYERRGPDWVYEMDTHHSNHLIAWHYLRESDLADEYLAAIDRWYEWLAYNTALEPDESGFYLNHSIETRLTRAYRPENDITSFGRTCAPMAEHIELARAFCESQEERRRRLDAARSRLERQWPKVADLRVGNFYGYSPVTFLHRDHVSWYPTNEQKAEARRQLPHRSDETFVHRRSDDKSDLSVLYIRQPNYYAVFNTGEPTSRQQRYGIGLLWTPDGGTVVQSHSAEEPSWGTRSAAATQMFESRIQDVATEGDGRPITFSASGQTLPSALPSIRYPLGDAGEKRVDFREDEIIISVRHAGRFVESIPLLLQPGERAELGSSSIQISPDASIYYGDAARAALRPMNRRVGAKQVHVLEIEASGQLEYRFQFDERD